METFMDLQIRQTHTYVGTYQHLDKWKSVGRCEVIQSQTLEPTEAQEEDYCEPRTTVYRVLVKPDDGITDKEIEDALHHSFTMSGCAHEYDCCGCRSYTTEKAERETGDLWKVTVHSSRNY